MIVLSKRSLPRCSAMIRHRLQAPPQVLWPFFCGTLTSALRPVHMTANPLTSWIESRTHFILFVRVFLFDDYIQSRCCIFSLHLTRIWKWSGIHAIIGLKVPGLSSNPCCVPAPELGSEFGSLTLRLIPEFVFEICLSTDSNPCLIKFW